MNFTIFPYSNSGVILRSELLRALASSLFALLLLTTLIWGGCISCEQYFMFGQTHSCCTADGHCKRKAPAKNSSTRDCNQIAFEHHKTIDLHVDLPMIAVASIASPVPDIELLPRRYHAPLPDPSPPDLQALHSTFLI